MLQLGEFNYIYMVIIVEFILLYFFLTFCSIMFIFLKKIFVSTAAMASVMSIGITTQGALFNFFGPGFFYSLGGKILSIFDLSLWSSFAFSFLMAMFNKKFKELHYVNPINRFGIGTWVAGTSICGILLHKQFSDWDLVIKFILCMNVGLWVFYISICLRALVEVFKRSLTENVHGVLLLTTVSTQSIVLLASNVYQGLPTFAAISFIVFGVCLYIFNALLIIKRYSKPGTWFICKDWNNTNCILHGALSITGLGCLVSHLLTRNSVIPIWICAMAVFLIVEVIELYRLFSRIKNYGWKQAVFIYDVSQWSRVFTFAMFYTFTYLSQSNDSSFISHLQHWIIISGIWMVLVLVVFEIGLVAKFSVENYLTKLKKSNPSNQIHSSF